MAAIVQQVEKVSYLKPNGLYTRDDLIADTYTQCVTKFGLEATMAEIRKVITQATCRQYKEKVPRHSTKRFTAEEIVTFLRHLLAEPDGPEVNTDYTVIDAFRQVFSQLTYYKLHLGECPGNTSE